MKATNQMESNKRTRDVEFQKKCNQAAEEYINNCKKFDLNVDASVVIALKTGWDIMQPTKSFREGSMLPLLGILDENDFITKVNMANVSMSDTRYRAVGNGNSNARVLQEILRKNKFIKDLDLSNTGLDDDGIKEICEGLAENVSIEKLNLSFNHFGPDGANHLIKALTKNETVKYLDLSRNALGFSSIHNLNCICGPKNVFMLSNGNFVFEEIMNSVTHGVAFLFSVMGANLLITEAADIFHTDYHFWACVLYSFSLMFLFLASCLYHSFFMLPAPSRILQILDHVGIYMLIAGSYTPFLLVGLHYHNSARVLLVAEWIMAFLGSVFAMCSDLNAPVTTFIELTFFLVMGLGVVLVYDILVTELTHVAVTLLFLAGGIYIVGIIFFILGEYKPIFHTIWHLFVVAAATIHWFAVYFFVLQTDISGNDYSAIAKSAVADLAKQVDSFSAAASAAAALVSAAAGNFSANSMLPTGGS